MIAQQNIVFFKDATSAGVSEYYYRNYNSEIISVEISGGFTSCNIVFEGLVDLENGEIWTPLAGINLSDYSITENGVATKAGIYEVAIEGVQKFRVRIAEVSGGNVTVFGRVIKTGV